MNRVRWFFKITSIFYISLFSVEAVAQTDTDFWFVVPEITVNHGYPGGIPANLRFATLNFPATVTISMPANTALFPDIVINIAANSTGTVNLDNWIFTAGAEQNKLENKALNASGINNFGLHITSTNLITAYYEISNSWNTDIWALKGKNALGTNFFTPFQNHGDNGSYAAPDATQNTYSAIDIVATEDGTTTVTVTPTKAASYGNAGNTIVANTPKTFTLTKGQTLSIFPLNKSRSAADRLVGTHVTSTKKIAITLKDDSIIHPSGGCRDVSGDQIVPVNVIGVEYIVMGTFLNNQDYVYVVATQPLTPIYVDGVLKTTINAGQQYQILLPNPTNYKKISSRLLPTDPYKPIYVFHIGGFGCEQGGAIVPPIDVCTGSTKVAFNRPKSSPFYLTMMVRDNAQDGFLVDGVVRNDLLPPASFVLVPGTPWRVARLGSFTTAQFAVGSHVISNTKDIFHLGIVNGDAGTTCMYGYFSDFNKFDPKSFVVETGGPGNTLCYGESSQLFASGGTKYAWTPDDFLDDPFSDHPIASNVTKSLKYKVVVSGVCSLKDSGEIELIVAPYMNPKFTTDVFSGCAPLTVNFINNSTGIAFSEWDFNSDGIMNPLDGDGLNNAPTFSHLFDNTTNDTIRYKITMVASDASSICFKQVIKSILVYPRIKSDFTTTILDANHCHPLSVTFNNASTGKIGPPSAENSLLYSWDFGDGGSSYLKNPTHIFENYNLGVTTYNSKLVITDKYNYCKDSTTKPVAVQPYIKASFTIDDLEGCSPFTVQVLNDSKGGISAYSWDRNGDGTDDYTSSGSWTLTYTNPTTTNTPLSIPIRLTVKNAGNCTDVITRTITVNPLPIVNTFTPGDIAGCSPLTVNYSATTTNATIYHWLIDGNAINNTLTAPYTFNNFGTADVTKGITFTASNTYGCSAVRTSNVTVHPYVEAQFTADKEVGCSPLTVNFTNASSPGSSTFQWDIGNNGTIDFTTKDISAQTFTYPVALNNTFTSYTVPVKLTAQNASGCPSSVIKNLTINPQSTASFSYIDNGNPNHCSPLAANFTSTVTNTETYQWEFGTYGAATIANPAFTFTNDGSADITVPVTLATNNRFGCSTITPPQNIIVRPNVKALFSLDKTAGCPPYNANVIAAQSPAITSYIWDFNGTPYTGPNQNFSNPANKTGIDITRNIKLTVNSGFCSSELTKSIVVYPEVKANLTALPSLTGCSPVTVNFQNTSAFYTTGTSVSNILWNFGDNTSSVATTISHVFTNTDNTIPKTFNVKLTATTDKGCVDDTTVIATANPNVTAAFNAQIIKQCTPMQIRVINASFAGPTISTYNWNFNGGTPAVPPNNDDFVVEYTNPDPENPVNRAISLTINNTFGCVSPTTSQTFTIDPQVIAGIGIAAPLTGGGVPIDRLCAPANFTFKNTSTGGSLSYTWDFTDGDIQTVFNRNNIAHLFDNRTAATKTFNVKLTAANTKGCSDFKNQAVIAYPEVDAKFSMTKDSSCTPFYIKLKDESLNGTRWSWDFGYAVPGRISTTPGETFTQIIDNDAIPEAIKKYKIFLQLDDLVTGCKDTVSQFLEVYPRITSSFTVTPISGCNPLTISFTNSSTGLGSYLWELDNGLSFNKTIPDPLTITNASTVNQKIVNIKLTATNALGCKRASIKTVTVAPDVIASFTSSILEACDPFTTQFINLTPSTAYNYSWTVNGVEEATTKDYSRLFSNTTNPPVINTYNVQLKSTYKLNPACASTNSKIITVNPRVYPNFSFSNTVDCHPLITNITNSTVSYNSSATYSWNLGNGTYSTLTNLSNQQYKNNSATKDTTYNIKLIARSIHQCVDSITKSVTVHPRPIASYTMDNGSLGCSPFLVNITNHSIGSDPLECAFNMGDGSPITSTFDKNLAFSYTYHNYTSDVQPYVISLKATTAFGCQNSTSQTVYSYPEVTASFAFNPGDAACNPFDVSLNNTSSNAYFYQWDFKDGTNSNLMSPTHRFVNSTENDKTFNVHLKATSEYECMDELEIPLTVYATPVANFSVNPPLKVYPDATFNFHNQSKPSADSWTYAWTFGDGYTSSLKEAGDHTYATWGPKANGFIYKSTLRIENAHCWDTTSNILRLLPAQPKPFFTADIYESCSPLESHFINASEYGSNFVWDFGDGTTTNESEPIHIFTKPGYYNVKLTVFGDGGETYYFKSFRVFQNPIADFSVFPSRVMLDDAEVHVYNLTQFANRYEWDLGDGTLETVKDPVHTYSKLGEYRISLKAYADYYKDDDVNNAIIASCIDDTSKFPAVYVEGIGKIAFPDAFMPSKTGSNGGVYDDIDYKNEVFHPVHYGVTEYKLMVFNRWGEQIYQSDDVKVGWDGYFQGKLCEQGVYIWRAIGKFTNGRIFDKKGNVTLLR